MPAMLESTCSSYQSILLDKPILFVGRHPDCDLIINNSRKVSRKHCCLIEVEGNILVRDLGSTNGIQVNARRVRGLKELCSGDKVAIGDCEFIFRTAGEVATAKQKKAAKKAAPKKPAKESDEDESPFHFNLEDASEVPAVPDHELSSDIPILLDEPEDDGFDLGENPFNSRKRSPRSKKRSDSDSQVELIAD